MSLFPHEKKKELQSNIPNISRFLPITCSGLEWIVAGIWILDRTEGYSLIRAAEYILPDTYIRGFGLGIPAVAGIMCHFIFHVLPEPQLLR